MTGLVQWLAWIERKMASIVVGEGLRCGLAEVKQGPLVVTFRVRLLDPSPTYLRKILALGPALAQAFQVDAVRVMDTARGILIEIPSPQPRTPSGLHLAQHTQALRIAVGLDQWRCPVHVDLAQHPTLLFVGPPRRGKTSAMKSILFALVQQNSPDQLRYGVISQRHTDWQVFEQAAGCFGIVNDPQEGLQVLEWGVRLMTRRSQGRSYRAAVMLVIDDLTNLLRREPKIATPLGEIATMGGGVNMFLLIGTHHAGSKAGTGDSNMEASTTARLVYKPASTSTGARSAGLGQLGLDQLSGYQGDCLFLLDGFPQRIATAHTNDSIILQLPPGRKVVAPWRTKTKQNQVETSQNQLPPVQPAVATLPITETLSQVRGERSEEQPVAVLADQIFPIDKRPLTEFERMIVQTLYQDGTGESINALCKRVYGSKYRKTFDWIVEGLQLAQPPETRQTDLVTTEVTEDE